MAEVCNELGFHAEAKIYSKILKNIKKACIVVSQIGEDDSDSEKEEREGRNKLKMRKQVSRKATSVNARQTSSRLY